MFSNEICLLAGNARPSASEQEAWNRISAFLAMPFSRSSSSERQPSRFEAFREVHPIRRILFLHPTPNRNEGSLESQTATRREPRRAQQVPTHPMRSPQATKSTSCYFVASCPPTTRDREKNGHLGKTSCSQLRSRTMPCGRWRKTTVPRAAFASSHTIYCVSAERQFQKGSCSPL